MTSGLRKKEFSMKTAEGNLKAPPRKRIVQWILDLWASLSNEVIKKSFKSCGLNINVDGSEDDVIHCLKQAQPCAAGREMLKSQMNVLKDLENETNPFSSSTNVTDSNIEEAGNEIFILDGDESEDELIDVEQISNRHFLNKHRCIDKVFDSTFISCFYSLSFTYIYMEENNYS